MKKNISDDCKTESTIKITRFKKKYDRQEFKEELKEALAEYEEKRKGKI